MFQIIRAQFVRNVKLNVVIFTFRDFVRQSAIKFYVKTIKMTSSPTRRSILALYKSLVRESEKFPNYNFRSYALRRVRDGFRANQSITDKNERIKQYNVGVDNLDVIRRQIIVGSLYKSDKLVIENLRSD